MSDHLTNSSSAASPEVAISRRRLLYGGPALGFAGLTAALVWGLGKDPSQIPSALLGQRVPSFNLPPVQGRKLGLSSGDLYGQVSLVNVFASWCVACRAEHPQLLWLAGRKIAPIFGIDYKDPPADAARWLDSHGDPYARAGADRNGRVAINWGVYGVPETFIVNADGIVMHKHIGPIMADDLKRSILPILRRLQAKNGGAS